MSTPNSLIVAPDLAHAIDAYWVALAVIKNILEDIDGCDQRLGYLKSLRVRLIERLQELDGILNPAHRAVAAPHRLAFALQHGIEFLGSSGSELLERLQLDRDLGYEELHALLREVTLSALERLPGTIPDGQGPTAQREVLRTMRVWSRSAAAMGEDLGFLEARFREL